MSICIYRETEKDFIYMVYVYNIEQLKFESLTEEKQYMSFYMSFCRKLEVAFLHKISW